MVINSEFDPVSDRVAYNPNAPLKATQDEAKLLDLQGPVPLDDLESSVKGPNDDWRMRR